ncbi:hypothetical protein GF373_14785 [bacterium]|nr:hypothetical protein [bacterium]
MTKVTPNKMLALCECEATPNPEIMQKEGPRWLYSLPWWGPGKRHPAEWIEKTYTHKITLTKNQLPTWKKK